MGRKKKQLVTESNLAEFTAYIEARRGTKLSEKTVSSLHKLASKTASQYQAAISEFEIEHAVVTYDHSQLNNETITALATIEHRVFNALNIAIENTGNLRTSFKNAQAQKKHKLKIKDTDENKVTVEMKESEARYFQLLRTACAKKGLALDAVLKEARYELDTLISLVKGKI